MIAADELDRAGERRSGRTPISGVLWASQRESCSPPSLTVSSPRLSLPLSISQHLALQKEPPKPDVKRKPMACLEKTSAIAPERGISLPPFQTAGGKTEFPPQGPAGDRQAARPRPHAARAPRAPIPTRRRGAGRARHSRRRRSAKGALFGGCGRSRQRWWASVGGWFPSGPRAEAVDAGSAVFLVSCFVLSAPVVSAGRGGCEAEGAALAPGGGPG